MPPKFPVIDFIVDHHSILGTIVFSLIGKIKMFHYLDLSPTKLQAFES